MPSLKLSSFLFLLLSVAASAELSPNFYEKSCPDALATIRETVNEAVAQEARMGGSLLRLHFHDCFVNGCDASILLDDNANFVGEKSAIINKNSARGFEVIDEIKSRVEKICPHVVSCADILAVTARDSVAALGGPTWDVLLGRRDSVTANVTTANSLFPLKFDFESLVAIFAAKGLTAEEMVTLSGAHTIGLATCRTYRARLYKESNIDSKYAAYLKSHCPPTPGTGDFNAEPLDVVTPTKFDNAYYSNLLSYKGLLTSDQLIYSNKTTDSKVLKYSSDSAAFFTDFGKAMIKMGNIEPLTGNQGVIRTDCRVPY